jgi:polyprenyl P-hydroxybenzoate/phenylacrylic acid decarboxylase-like protein
MPADARKRLIVAITGSSAPHLGFTLLRELQNIDSVESHLIISRGAELSIKHEMNIDPVQFRLLADVTHDPSDLAAPVSSGSFKTMGMIVIPCSMHTLATIATGNSADLVSRAADVCLKERRRLVLVTRETPLNLIHIRNMETVTLAGGTILPPVPAFYHAPRTIEDLLLQTVGKALDQFDIPHDLYRRWGE